MSIEIAGCRSVFVGWNKATVLYEPVVWIISGGSKTHKLSPGLVASYDIQPGDGVGLFWDTKHIFTFLLTFPRPTRGGYFLIYNQ